MSKLNRLGHAQAFAGFLEGLQPILERVSYAFSKLILICQGSAAFQAQVCHPGLLQVSVHSVWHVAATVSRLPSFQCN
jgi:hypothetical protein